VFYRLLTTLLDPIARLVQAFSRADSRFGERMGEYETPVGSLAGRFCVWLHGASAGEVNAIVPLVKALREEYSTLHLTLTTTSLTGRALAAEKCLADRVMLAPLDLPGPMRKAFDSIQPRLILIAETEFWPLWMSEAKRRSIPVVLVNGRVSDKSYPWYLRFRFFFKRPLASFASCLVQTELDRERLMFLGVAPERVEVMGQMKYDLGAPDPLKVKAFGEALGLPPDQPLFTFGSLREGEDQEVLAVLPRLFQAVPKARVILAPRHFRNLGLFERVLNEMGQPWVFRSQAVSEPWRVLVLDTMGELGLAFALSRAAFVGGTLVPVGGHNVMEPVLSAVPVCYGPHVANVREAAGALNVSGGAARIVSATEAVDWMARFADRELSTSEGAKALLAVEPLRGATRKTLGRLRPFVGV
jgi:3-deoxy-D-manno-octulosonic-acid transferase